MADQTFALTTTTLCKFDERGQLIIPVDLTMPVAARMYDELRNVETVAHNGRFQLIAKVADMFGDDAARELTGDQSGGYTGKVLSIHRNTAEIAREFPLLKPAQLAELAPLSKEPERQKQIAREAAEHDLPATLVRAAVQNVSPEVAMRQLRLQQFQRALDGLSDDPNWLAKCVHLVTQAQRKLDEATNHATKTNPNRRSGFTTAGRTPHVSTGRAVRDRSPIEARSRGRAADR